MRRQHRLYDSAPPIMRRQHRRLTGTERENALAVLDVPSKLLHDTYPRIQMHARAIKDALLRADCPDTQWLARNFEHEVAS